MNQLVSMSAAQNTLQESSLNRMNCWRTVQTDLEAYLLSRRIDRTRTSVYNTQTSLERHPDWSFESYRYPNFA